jgi:hypothetical protein
VTAAVPDTINTLLNSRSNTNSASESDVHSYDSPYQHYFLR